MHSSLLFLYKSYNSESSNDVHGALVNSNTFFNWSIVGLQYCIIFIVQHSDSIFCFLVLLFIDGDSAILQNVTYSLAIIF